MKYSNSILEDREFEQTRTALDTRRKLLKKEDRGSRPFEAETISNDEVRVLYKCNILWITSAEALINTVWLKNSIRFGLRGCDERRQMCWSDVKLLRDANGTEYLEYCERQTKTRSGEEPRNIKPVKAKAFARPDGPPEKDPVFVQRGDSLLILSGQLKILLCRRTFVWLQWEVSFKLTTLHWSFSAFFFKFGPLFLRLSKELRSLWPFFQLFRENSLRQGVSWIMFRSDVAELLRVYCLLDFSNCDRKLASLFSQSIKFKAFSSFPMRSISRPNSILSLVSNLDRSCDMTKGASMYLLLHNRFVPCCSRSLMF